METKYRFSTGMRYKPLGNVDVLARKQWLISSTSQNYKLLNQGFKIFL